MCARAWAWRYINGIKGDSGGGALVGHAAHEVLEAWLRHGTPPDETQTVTYWSERKRDHIVRYPGRMIVAALHHFPPRTPELKVEEELRFYSPSGAWVAKLDSRLGPRIDDLKTLADLKYALQADPEKPDYLGDDPQALLYAAGTRLLGIRDRYLELHWNYVQTVPRQGRHVSRKVHLTLDTECDRTIEGLDQIERSARNMAAVAARGLQAMDLPPSPNACGDYGGCPHVDRCKISDREKWDAMTKPKSNVDPEVERLLASLGEGGNPGPTFLDEPPDLPDEDRMGEPEELPPDLPDEEPPELPEIAPLEREKDPINPPEAPPDSGEPCPIMGVDDGPFDPDAADRKALKEYALARSWVESGCGWGEKKLRELVKANMAGAEKIEGMGKPDPGPAGPVTIPLLDGSDELSPGAHADFDQVVHALQSEIAQLKTLQEEMDRELTGAKRTAAQAFALVRALLKSYERAKPEVYAALLQAAGMESL